MNSLKFKFFIIFIILGAVVSFIGYAPYMRYITYSYTEVMSQVLHNIEEQHVLLQNIDRIVELGETVLEYCEPKDSTLEAVMVAHARYDGAINGEFGEDVQRNILEFESLNRYLFNIRKAFNLEFVSYMQVMPNNEYRYVLSSDFSYKWVNEWGLNDLLYPNYSGEELGSTISRAVETKSLEIADVPISQESWGAALIPAFLPISNAEGKIVGVLEADYRLSSVNRFRLNAVIVLGCSILLSALASILLSMHVSATLVTPIKELKRFADALANKDFSVGIVKFRKDELGSMQKSMIITRDNLQQALIELQEERDEIAAMKDNLKVGIFLLDMNFIIQDQYSIAMETIFETKNLHGKTLLNLLSASFKDDDIILIQDFLVMILSGSVKQKKIDSMNPLFEFKYVNPGTKEHKTLRCVFSRIKRESGEIFVLGTVEDITAEVKLRDRLAKEEKTRQEEMRLLFEIVNIEPNILTSFLSDADYNFNQILELLRNEDRSHQDIFVDIYQFVHATKSDAAIIGLLTFADKLHEIENEIKQFRNLPEIDFSSMLRFTIEIEQMLQEKDKIQEIIKKLKTTAIKTEVIDNQDEYILVESLKRAAARVADDTKKNIVFVNDGIDNAALKHLPRRELKDILVQIVRNAAYHGIETPEERTALGKNPEGRIVISVQEENGSVHVALGDDGKGLDFNKIRIKAREKGLITEEEASDNKKVLEAIFAPAFSTASSEDIHAGRGIGLNLVRDRIKQLNGSIKVSSKVEKGTTFHIYIPLAK